MNINRPVIVTPDNETRFQNFIVFEPASSRVSETDILLRGEKIYDLYQELYEKLEDTGDISLQIIMNRVRKIGQMLDMLGSYDNLIMTKFFDRIWRRYSFISNIGESFLDLRTFIDQYPAYDIDKKLLLATRIDDDDDDFESKSDDNDDDSSDDDTSDDVETSEKKAETVSA